MSWAAQKWAIEQDAGDPTTKLLLVVLASYAAADNSCFPSQETLARKVECSERSVRSHLAKLEGLGLIRRHERRKHGGYKVSDLIVLCMEQADEQLDLGAVEILPAKSAGENSHRQRATVSQAISDSLTGKSCRYIEDEPIREPINEPTSVGGSVEWEDFSSAYAPRLADDQIGMSRKAWRELSPADQADAVKYATKYCRKQERAGHRPLLSSEYLRQRAWRSLVPKEAKPIAVEWVEENSLRWRELVAAGKRESFKIGRAHV